MNIKYRIIFAALLGITAASAQGVCNTNTVESLAPDARYVSQASGSEVWDKHTGLVWKLCAEGLSGSQCAGGSLTGYDWKAAVELGGATWRLPNIKELASLVALECDGPAINSVLFPNSPSGWVWSSSPDRLNSDKAWRVDFQTGKIESQLKSTQPTYVRLVKDR